MVASILSIVAALLPVLLDWLEGRMEGKPYEEKQAIRRAAYSGDVDILSAELDRLREKSARRRAAGR